MRNRNWPAIRDRARIVLALGGLVVTACSGGGHGGGGGGGGSPTSPSTGTSGAPPTFTADNGDFQGVHPAPVVIGGATTYIYQNTASPGTAVEATHDGVTFAVTPATYPAGVSRTIVSLPDGRFRMYYFADATSIAISSAISSDGLTWTAEAGTRYSDPNLGAIRALVLPTGGYRLYYPTGVGINSLVSTDGLSFNSEGPVTIPPGDSTFSWGASAAAYLNGQFHMVLTRVPTSTGCPNCGMQCRSTGERGRWIDQSWRLIRARRSISRPGPSEARRRGSTSDRNRMAPTSSRAL